VSSRTSLGFKCARGLGTYSRAIRGRKWNATTGPRIQIRRGSIAAARKLFNPWLEQQQIS